MPNNRQLVAFYESEFEVDDWAMRNGISTAEEKDDYFYDFENTFLKMIRDNKKDHHTFLLTSEHFHSRLRKKEEISAFHHMLSKQFDEIEVICYFRDQYEVALSSYSTILKVGWWQELDIFLQKNVHMNNYYYNYLQIANNWSEIFGRENCHFLLYDRAQKLEKTFTNTVLPNLDWKKIGYLPDTSKSNLSLTAFEAAAYRIVNKRIPYYKGIGWINKRNQRARRVIHSKPEFKKGRICSDKQTEIRKLFEEMNQKFFEKYFTPTTTFALSPSISNKLTQEEVEKAFEGAMLIGFNTIWENVETIDINLIRDTAVQIRDGYPRAALDLMRLAHEHRPHGERIEAYIEDWEEEDN
jgi:hypothetical protein